MRFAPIMAFIHMAACGFIQVNIKSFTVEVVTDLAWQRQRAESSGESRGTNGTSAPNAEFREERQMLRAEGSTEQIDDKCRFRFPEQKHVNGILNDMMNQLARVYVKTELFVSKQVSKQTRKQWSPEEVRRALATRFKRERQRRKLFFDELFINMTTEYSNMFNISDAGRLGRAASSACPPQREARRRWQALLQHAAARLRAAVRACARLHLRERDIAPASWLGRQVHRHINNEIDLIKTKQLRALCENFHLCYQNEFVRTS